MHKCPEPCADKYFGHDLGSVYAKGEKENWLIRGVEVLVAEMQGAFWLIANSADEDKTFPADGPYPTAEAAAVSATLQESP